MPESPQRSRWERFLFASLSNAAGAMVAVALLYLIGVVAGVVRANPRLLAGAFVILAIALVGAFIMDRLLMLFIRWLVRWAAKRYPDRYRLP